MQHKALVLEPEELVSLTLKFYWSKQQILSVIVVFLLGLGSMFYLSRIEHKLRLPPSLLSLPIRDAIHMELEKLFLDKVFCC